MKRLFSLWITFFTGLLTAASAPAQTLSRFTTPELLNKVKKEGTGFINSNPEIQLNCALPLIDCEVAVELARASGLQISNNYVYAISLQCRDDSLKQMLLTDILLYDKLCNDELISKNEYDQGGVAGAYEYGRLHNAMLEQIDKSDTSFLKTATKEFEFWAPMASDYIDIIMKPGMHQLAIKSGKRKFTRCMLASAANCSFWIACIYLITGKEAYGSANEQLNEVYRKLMNRLRIDKRADNMKGFIRLGKQNTVTTTAPVNTLDSLDSKQYLH